MTKLLTYCRRSTATAALFILGITGVQAAGPYLHGFDPISILPPPPALHTLEDSADRDSAFSIYSASTPEERATAKAEHKVTFAIFATALGPDYLPEKCPKLVALFTEVEAETRAVADRGKAHWKRPRPNVDDPVRFSDPGDPETSPSYPSSHSTRGTVLSLLLADIFPDRSAAILQKGRYIGWLRVKAGVHTPLDIYAGRVLGLALYRAFLSDPAFQQDFADAKAEVAAAEGK
jgi:acid phosphatase (class A)